MSAAVALLDEIDMYHGSLFRNVKPVGKRLALIPFVGSFEVG